MILQEISTGLRFPQIVLTHDARLFNDCRVVAHIIMAMPMRESLERNAVFQSGGWLSEESVNWRIEMLKHTLNDYYRSTGVLSIHLKMCIIVVGS